MLTKDTTGQESTNRRGDTVCLEGSSFQRNWMGGFFSSVALDAFSSELDGDFPPQSAELFDNMSRYKGCSTCLPGRLMCFTCDFIYLCFFCEKQEPGCSTGKDDWRALQDWLCDLTSFCHQRILSYAKKVYALFIHISNGKLQPLYLEIQLSS